mgnify:CR=1 FL=1
MSALVDARNVHSIRRDFTQIAVFLALVWVIFALDRVLPLERLGLIPRDAGGLVGILAMPFLHADLAHLMANSVPLAVTLLLLAGSRANSGAIVLLIVVIGGAALWLLGRGGVRHIGASGLVFGLIAFHIFAGVFERRLQSLVITGVVGLLYASTLLRGVLPMQPGVSWDGHLFGALAGALVALLSARLLREQARAPVARP